MRILFLFLLIIPAITASAQKKSGEDKCRFVIRCDEKYMNKEVVITKIGITGLTIKTTEKVKKKLTLYSEDKIIISEEALRLKIGNICAYKSWFLDKIEFTYDENTTYKKTIPMIIQFHFKKG